MSVVLLVSVFLIAACGLIYELIASTLASYLLGDSVLQFSTVIGSYLAAMGLGSFISRYIAKGLIARFVEIELMVGLVGGFSSPLLFLAFAYTESFRLLLYLLVIVVGTLVGLEIPLLMRILRERFQFKELIAHVLTFDYLGSLGASLLFPILLVPRLGMVRSSLLFGLINAGVALWSVILFRHHIARRVTLYVQSAIVIVLLGAGMVLGQKISNAADNQLYADDVIFARDTKYQRIVLTKWKDDLRLFLNSHLQFSSRDEYRYHEALVHPGLAAIPNARRVLVLGGGDGLAVREILRYPNVAQIQLTDLDSEMTHLFSVHPVLRELNGRSLTNSRVHITNADAFVWLDQTNQLYDFVVVDFPDPTNYSLGKLYTTAFYRLLSHHVARGGLVVVQSTSPLFARQSYWCIAQTMKDAGFTVSPYHVYVPSFGEWGFMIGGLEKYSPPGTVPAGLRFLSAQNLPELFQFPLDMRPVTVMSNRLNDQVLVRYYDAEWKAIAR